MADEILDLNTIVEHKTINIVSALHKKGKLYEYANLQDLSPYEYRRLIACEGDADELLNVEKKLTAAQERALDKALTELVQILVPKIEPSVVAGLTTTQRQLIKVTWANEVAAAATGARSGDVADPPRRRSTTAARSRSSKNSSAAPRPRGSTRRRG